MRKTFLLSLLFALLAPSMMTAQEKAAYVHYIEEDGMGILVFCYDRFFYPGLLESDNFFYLGGYKDLGESSPEYYSYFIDSFSDKVYSVEFEESFADYEPTWTTGLFSGLHKVTDIVGLQYLNTSNVTNMSNMFLDCYKLEDLDVSNFDTGNVTDMSGMFANCSRLRSIDVSNFDTGNVKDMTRMFANCTSLTGLDVSKWNTRNVEKMGGMDYYYNPCQGMFSGCSGLTYLDVSRWDTGNVTDMARMFEGCYNLTSLDVSNWNTCKVENMLGMFKDCHSLTTLDVSSWNTVNVSSMSFVFGRCSSLTSLDLGSWNTDKVENMDGLFFECSSLTNINLNGFKTSNVKEMTGMFAGCSSLTNLDVTGFDTSNVTGMSAMFRNCSSLSSLDLSGFNTENVTEMGGRDGDGRVGTIFGMFYECSKLETIYCGKDWKTNNVGNSDHMFYGCTSLVGEKGTIYDENHVEADYAHADGGPDNPGYFTLKVPTPTGVNSIKTERAEAVYDLQGRRVNGTAQKGIYIVNGKKVVR